MLRKILEPQTGRGKSTKSSKFYRHHRTRYSAVQSKRSGYSEQPDNETNYQR